MRRGMVVVLCVALFAVVEGRGGGGGGRGGRRTKDSGSGGPPTRQRRGRRGGGRSRPPAPLTDPPSTPAPDTLPPDTLAPDTQAPDTSAPATQAPDTPAPATPAPPTAAPATSAPATSAPPTAAPPTSAPPTSAPPTPAPPTSAPPTPAPETPVPAPTPVPPGTLPPLPPPNGDFGNAITTPGQGILRDVHATYLPVVISIVRLIEAEELSFRPLLVRLAWQSVAQFDPSRTPMGGNGGCLRTDPELGLEENIGLDVATLALEAVKSAHPFISYADLYSLAGNTALEYMGSPTLYFRPGRTDVTNPATQCVADNERLPTKNTGDTYPHLTTLQYFFDKFGELGFSLDTDPNALYKMVSLMGGHGMGAMHLAVSGNEGQWTTNNLVFGTEYFFNLNSGDWDAAEQGRTDLQYREGRSVMLPIDIVMRADDRLRSIVDTFSRDRALFEGHFVAAWRQLQENGR